MAKQRVTAIKKGIEKVILNPELMAVVNTDFLIKQAAKF
jgi:hypothetical protein